MIEVVIPAYNAAPFLRETLLSVAQQTLVPDLVTVVDDSSADGTMAIAHGCAEELKGRLNVAVCSNAGPRGPSAARNTAIRRGQADWIALLDSDDLMEPYHLETLMRVARSADDTVLAFGDSVWFHDPPSGERQTMLESFFQSSGVAALPAIEVAPGCFTLRDGTFAPMLRHGLFGTSACLFRRDAALGAGLFDEAMMLNEDTDFFLRLVLQGRSAFTRQRITRKRHHHGNLSHNNPGLRFSRGIAITHLKLSRWSGPPALGNQQAAEVERAVRRSMMAYLYRASRSGPRDYWEAAAFAREAGRGWMAANPRHIARSVWHAIVGGVT